MHVGYYMRGEESPIVRLEIVISEGLSRNLRMIMGNPWVGIIALFPIPAFVKIYLYPNSYLCGQHL
ncbi:transmembrane protein, putative [Medicago truncatula]|uniref:Transmembrane protein, putative n=1 Tax=Medicago truncatula TaxID=3880 RepID=A0A072U215_MEDTR|nr:transmembrane protein, putative [Medicago truncatula]